MGSSAYWPDLRTKILGLNDTLACVICHECMSPPSGHQEVNHEAVVLPCGHIFGKYCINAWVTSFIGDNAPNCPSCRANLTHPNCGHLVNAIPISPIISGESRHTCQSVPRRPGNVGKALATFSTAVRKYELDNAKRAALQKFPATIPEGGAVRHDCADCQIQGLLRLFTRLSSPTGTLNGLGSEFVGFIATAGVERWVLQHDNKRAKVIRTPAQNHNLMQECYEMKNIMERAWGGPWWPTKDLSGLEFTLCICSWEEEWDGWT